MKATIPASRLLVFDLREGWEPLCDYLGVPVPDTDFPKTNDTKAFWASTQSPQAAPEARGPLHSTSLRASLPT